MASGGIDDHGGGGCNKRYRQASSCTDDNDTGEMSGCRKRCGAAPSSGANDDGCSDVYGGHAHETVDDDDGSTGEDDYMYESDGCDDDEEAEKTKDDASTSACDKELRYIVLTENVVRARQEADTAKVAEVLSIPAGFAAVLLRHFRWRVGRVQEAWFSDERRVRHAVGLPADGELVPAARSLRPYDACAICFDEYPADRMRSAGCSHYYCDGCWRGYVGTAVGDGPRCLSLRCPDPSCSAAVVQELVDEVVEGADRTRYARFWFRSYVEEGVGRVRWCAGPGCTRAVEFLGCAAGDDAADVFCECRHGFCWSCGEEAHRPVSCGTVRAWLAKNRSDSETANWVVANTKLCPKCRRPIEKNQGCNHMRCSPPCGYQFCWLCLQPAGGQNHYACRPQLPDKADDGGDKVETETEEEQVKRQAKASLDRYLYHYERWASNRVSLETVFKDMAALERWELEDMAKAVDLPATELGFVTEAYHQIADGRRVLRWAHAYGYFLDPERDAAKSGLFDDLQNQANRWLECLHGCAELERKEIFGCASGCGEAAVAAVAAETFRAYRQKVANLTGVTRKFLGNLVRAFETDLPEVVVKPAD